ncbi:MAG: SEC-C domain-containing protein, partial [Devosia sp.]
PPMAMSEIHLDPTSGQNEIPDSVGRTLGAGPRGSAFAEASGGILGALAGGASSAYAGPGAAADPSLAPIDPALLVGVSRNAPCPCGSGKKFKHCHGAF